MSIDGVAELDSIQLGLDDSSSIDDTRTQFLQLLIAQLENQDPLSPADTDQMTAQMMSLGQLEQLFNLNEQIETLVATEAGSAVAHYSSMIGKEATSLGNTFEVNGSNKGKIIFDISSMPEDTLIRIFDQYNNLVREMDYDVQSVGEHTIEYDGKNSVGDDVSDGYYTYTIEATDADGEFINGTTYSHGTISSMQIVSGVPVFKMGHSDVSMGDIQKVF